MWPLRTLEQAADTLDVGSAAVAASSVCVGVSSVLIEHLLAHPPRCPPVSLWEQVSSGARLALAAGVTGHCPYCSPWDLLAGTLEACSSWHSICEVSG